MIVSHSINIACKNHRVFNYHVMSHHILTCTPEAKVIAHLMNILYYYRTNATCYD